jgi:hypothetical protein
LVFGESVARLLLIAHTAVAVACVGASTHLVLWLRRWRRGQFDRVRAVRRFAAISAALYLVTAIVGNLLYPTYKVSVRVQFLDNPSEITREVEARQLARQRVESVYSDGAATPAATGPTEGPAKTGAKMARWFDIKEHWVVFGAILALAAALILFAWNPKKDGGDALGQVVFWMAVAASATAWLAAIIGVSVSSYRAVGGL